MGTFLSRFNNPVAGAGVANLFRNVPIRAPRQPWRADFAPGFPSVQSLMFATRYGDRLGPDSVASPGRHMACNAQGWRPPAPSGFAAQ